MVFKASLSVCLHKCSRIQVGVGWFGGCCLYCDNCRRGDFLLCEKGEVCGITYDGGYGQYVVAVRFCLFWPGILLLNEATRGMRMQCRSGQMREIQELLEGGNRFKAIGARCPTN